MKNYFTPSLLLMFSLAIACKSPKVVSSQVASPTKVTAKITSPCDQTIKYYSSKIILANGGEEMNAKTEIIINPSAKLISLSSEMPNMGTRKFDTIIENFNCNLTSDMKAGQSTYTGYIKQIDGNSTKAMIKVEATDGALTITNADPEEEEDSKFSILIDKWEVLR